MKIKHININSAAIIVMFTIVLIAGIVEKSCEALEVAVIMALLFNTEFTIHVHRKVDENG